WHPDDRLDSRLYTERSILRNIDPGADDVALHQREHECGAGLHEAANINASLGDDAVERGYDALVSLILIEYPDKILLSRNIRLSNRDCGLLGLQCQPIGVALLSC